MLPDVTAPDSRAADGDSVRRPRRARRLLAAAGWALAAVAGFAVYLRLAQTMPVNSDGAGIALQGWDLLHGNLLLHGWRTTDVSFYTTELPEYALVEAARGLGAGVVHVATAITYTLAVLLAAAVAKGRAAGREAAFRMLLAAGIMLAPQLGGGTNTLLSGPDHIGTSVPVLLAFLLVDRCPRRPWTAVAASAVLAWAAVADAVTLVAAVVPVIVVCAVRLVQAAVPRLRGGQSGSVAFEAWLGAGAVAAGVIGEAVPPVIRALGGFQMRPLSTGLSPFGVIIGHNLSIVGQGFLLLGGAWLPRSPAGAQDWFTGLHLAGIALAAVAVAVTAWRFFRAGDLLPRLLLAGIVVNAAAYLAGTHAVALSDAREMAPVLPLAAALAGRQLPGLLSPARRLSRRVAAGALGLVLAGYAAGLALELTVPPAPPQNARLTAWLTRHPLGGAGLSSYWEANAVTLTSGGRVPVRAVITRDGKVVPDRANLRADWYDPSRSAAHYVVLASNIAAYTPGLGYPGFSDVSAVRATFGTPDRTYRAGPYTILWWHKNLLGALKRISD